MKTQWTKVIYPACVKIKYELAESLNVIMMETREWNPEDMSMSIQQVDHRNGTNFSYERDVDGALKYEYLYSTSDKAIMHGIEPTLCNLMKRIIYKAATRNILQVLV